MVRAAVWLLARCVAKVMVEDACSCYLTPTSPCVMRLRLGVHIYGCSRPLAGNVLGHLIPNNLSSSVVLALLHSKSLFVSRL